MDLNEMLDRNAVIISANIWPFCQSSITHLHFKAVTRLIILTKSFRYQLNHMSFASELILGNIKN